MINFNSHPILISLIVIISLHIAVIVYYYDIELPKKIKKNKIKKDKDVKINDKLDI